MAPELTTCYNVNPYDPSKVDVWAAAVVIFVMLTGCLPYVADSLGELFYKIANDDPLSGLEPRMLSKLSPNAIEFLEFVLVKNPTERPTAKEVLSHSWLKEIV